MPAPRRKINAPFAQFSARRRWRRPTQRRTPCRPRISKSRCEERKPGIGDGFALTLGDDLSFATASRSMLRKQVAHPLRPAIKPFFAGKRNNDREYILCLARYHRAFRIACGTSMSADGVAEHW